MPNEISKRIAQLIKVMESIRDEPRAPDHTLASPNLYPSLEALKATIDFLDGFAELRGSGHGTGLTKPLWDLLVALGDLEKGTTASMLRTGKTGVRGTSTHYQATTAWAAIFLDTLLADGFEVEAASAMVATELNNVEVSSGSFRNNVTAQTVVNWREGFSRNKGARDAQPAWDRVSDADAVAGNNKGPEETGNLGQGHA